MTAQTVLTQVIGLALFAVQAPLLGPTAFGLFSFVMVFVGFCELVLSGGATEALLSIGAIESRHFEVVTTVSVLFSLVLGAGIFAGARPLAEFCGQPALMPLFRWMAILPLIASFTSSPNAATKREMQFRPLAIRAIVGFLAGGVVGVILTIRGDGAWALVWQAIVQRFVSAVVLWLGVPIKLRFAWSARHFRELWKFAAPVIVASMMGWASGQIPRLILGLFLGPTDLGLFGMAARLNDILVQATILPTATVDRVSLRQFATNPDGRDGAIRRVMFKLSALCFPLAIGGAAALPALFHVWLDPRWFGGIVPSQLMLLTCVPLVTVYAASAVLLAFNRQAADALISTTQTLAIVAVVFVSAPFGLLIAVAAIALRPAVMLPLQLTVLSRKCAVHARTLVSPQMPALVAAALMGIAVGLLRSYLETHYGSVPALLIAVAAGAAIYVGLMLVLLPRLAADLMPARGFFVR